MLYIGPKIRVGLERPVPRFMDKPKHMSQTDQNLISLHCAAQEGVKEIRL